MHTYDKIIAQAITVLLICVGLVCLLNILDLDEYIIGFPLIAVILGSIVIFVNLNQLRTERALIHSRLDDLQSKGLRVYRKKFEKLLYSRDVADLPKLGKILYDFDVLAVVQPKDHQEVKSIIRLCEEFAIPLIPRGAGTGGYGGALPTQNGIILIFTQIKEILSVNTETNTVEVETGITWRRLREFLEKNGYDLYTYPSSAPSSSIGGWIASGGYGIGSSKFGDITQSVHSVSVIGTNGEVFVLDKPSDFIGNFGTIGVIWKATLKVRPKIPVHHIAILPKSREIGLEKFNLLQKMNPFYLRYIDQVSLKWITNDEVLGSIIKNADSGMISATFLETDWSNSQGESELLDDILPTNIAQELWDDRFYTLRLKRGGPSLIVSEVIVPSDVLRSFLAYLSKWFKEENYSVEIVALNNRNSMVMVWFPTDQRKRSLPILGSIPYLFHWFRTFQVIRIAWTVNGSTCNNGGLWLSPYPNKEDGGNVRKIKRLKKKTDPYKIFNPGKLESTRIPRFFPILSWNLFLKISLPIASIFYRVLPKRYR